MSCVQLPFSIRTADPAQAFYWILGDARMSTIEENMRLMQTLDDAWNTQDWETFDKRHTKEVDVFWTGQPQPTHSRPSHREEAIAFFKNFS